MTRWRAKTAGACRVAAAAAALWSLGPGRVAGAEEIRAGASGAPREAPNDARRPPTATFVTPARTSGGEPSVEDLCQAAVALALAEPERAQSFLTRARLAGWLPELRFRFFRRFARTEGLTLDDTATTTPVDVSSVDDVRYEWRATWDLSRIVFNSDELQAHAEALRMADVRREIQSLVVRLYFERRRLLIVSTGPAAASGGAGSDAEERRQLRVTELEAELEALTGRPFFRSTGGTSAEAHP